MKGKRRPSIGSHERDDEGEELDPERLEVEHVIGDVLWVRRDDDGTWWPAVVVNDNNISETSKPCNRVMGDVLVRLYGSYQYTYADPFKCCSEFEITLKENGGCYSEMFVEALEQDLPQSRSGQSKGKGYNFKGTSNGRASASKDKNSNRNRVNYEIESSNHARISPRKQINMNTPQRRMKDDNFLSKIVEEAMTKVSNQDGLEKELKFDSPNTEGNSKGETPKQDGMRNKVKRNLTSTSGQAKTKSHDQGEKKRLKKKGSSAAEDSNYQSPKKDGEQEKHELSPSSAGGTFFGRLQELRRTKVMQTLGLVAPSGSPFN